jgi:hypothetical protein
MNSFLKKAIWLTCYPQLPYPQFSYHRAVADYLSLQKRHGNHREKRSSSPVRGEAMMKRHCASQDPTLLEIAEVLGIQPEIVLEWIIEGRLLVALQGSKTIMMLDSNQSLKNHNSGKILIMTKQPSQRWLAFSC